MGWGCNRCGSCDRPGGAIGVGLSWPGRYSHSLVEMVEMVEQRDLVHLPHLAAMLMPQC